MRARVSGEPLPPIVGVVVAPLLWAVVVAPPPNARVQAPAEGASP